jgi:hypothetical protein
MPTATRSAWVDAEISVSARPISAPAWLGITNARRKADPDRAGRVVAYG